MKKIILFIMTIGLLIIQSCSDKNESEDIKIQPRISLAGKVYGLRSDTITCDRVLPGNGYLPELLFLDDSSFIKIIPINCADIGWDFTCSRYYSGKYKIDEKELRLTFNQKMVVHYIKSKKKPNSDMLLLSTHVESEKSDMSRETLVKFDCKGKSYFEPCDVRGHVMTLTSDTLSNHITYLKNEKIWDGLFDKK